MTQLLRYGHFFDDKHPDQNRGWVIGDYVDDPAFKSDDVQVKYQHQQAGDFREAKDIPDPDTHTLAILVHGKCRAKFVEQDQEIHLNTPGDYIRWSPDTPHEFEYLEDTLIITIRWKR